MAGRVYSRPAATWPPIAMVAVAALVSATFTVMALSGDQPGTALIPIVVTAVGGLLVWVAWRRSHCLVTVRGVGSGLFRRRWVEWDDFRGFECDRPQPGVALLYSCGPVEGDRVLLFHVPFNPLLFDTVDRHDRATTRAVARLDQARTEARPD